MATQVWGRTNFFTYIYSAFAAGFLLHLQLPTTIYMCVCLYFFFPSTNIQRTKRFAWLSLTDAYSLVSARFILMLQHALTPNSVGSLVAWQQEAGVHAFTIEGRKKNPGWVADFNRCNSLGFPQWHGAAVMSPWQSVRLHHISVRCDVEGINFSLVFQKPCCHYRQNI